MQLSLQNVYYKAIWKLYITAHKETHLSVIDDVVCFNSLMNKNSMLSNSISMSGI